MALTKGRIDRQGTISFHDAKLMIMEEGISEARNHGKEREWEATFKKQVFLRVVQQLNRMGWTCVISEQYTKQYSLKFAQNFRDCTKGDLCAELSVRGRCVELEMWQGVNTPTRPDNGGRYESNKEGIAPYLLRLEMIRTRNRIRDYLCNVFTGYKFNDKKRSTLYPRPLECTAMEKIQENYQNSRHFKGDWQLWLEKEKWQDDNRKSADGPLLNHGQKVWFYDYKGRLKQGTAYYNINNMWFVLLGKYDYSNECGSRLFTTCPDNPRLKRNDGIRRKALEAALAKAVTAMNFERAATLRDVLFAKGQPLFWVRKKKSGEYHRPGFSGYTLDRLDAGKFTAAEIAGWEGSNEVIPIPAN